MTISSCKKMYLQWRTLAGLKSHDQSHDLLRIKTNTPADDMDGVAELDEQQHSNVT